MVLALREGFPDIQDELERFESAVQEGKIVPYDFFERRARCKQIVIDRWAMDIHVSPLRLAFILSHIKRIALERIRKTVGEVLNRAVWIKGYCPVCGAFPGIAVIHENGEGRQLHCFQCGQDWHFSGVICPRCECYSKKEMGFFHFDDNDGVSAFACEQCKSYLITINQVDDLREYNLDLSAMGLTYLDLIMQQKGYLPMINCGWNLFSDSRIYPKRMSGAEDTSLFTVLSEKQDRNEA